MRFVWKGEPKAEAPANEDQVPKPRRAWVKPEIRRVPPGNPALERARRKLLGYDVD